MIFTTDYLFTTVEELKSELPKGKPQQSDVGIQT